jgi:hypothetical protein
MSERVKKRKSEDFLCKSGSFAAIIIVMTLLACSSAPDQFGKLDLKKWRGDRGGCNGVRASILANFKAESQNLKGKSANTIGEWLGRPDINQIADRNQKFYIYFLERGPQCDKAGAKSNSRSVALRLSAIGLVSEITYQNGLP